MDNIFPRIFSFVLLCHLVIGSSSDPNLKSCLSDFSKSWISIAYFSENYFKQVNYTEEYLAGNDKTKNYEELSLSICTCRKNQDAMFFATPYMDNEIEEMYAYCYEEDHMQTELFDEDEILDSLLLQQIESMSATVLDPLPYDFYQNDNASCYDFYGKPTKQILGQTTCMISVNVSTTNEVSLNVSSSVKDYFYSGPLLARELIDFHDNSDVVNHCFTTFTDNDFESDLGYDDRCFFKHSIENSSLICCCNKSPELCKPPPQDKLLCFPGNFQTNKIPSFGSILTSDYFTEEYSNNSCFIKMNYTGLKGKKFFSIDYGANSTCYNEVDLYRQDSFCSTEFEFTHNVRSVTKCCKDGHFCNQKLIPKTDPILKFYCKYKAPILLYLTGTCDLFYDIAKENRHIIYEGFNGIIAENSRTATKDREASNFNKRKHFGCNFVYIKIIKDDSGSCGSNTFLFKDEYKTFLHCTCSIHRCDEYEIPKPINADETFECQGLQIWTKFYHDDDGTTIGNEAIKSNDTWICYVSIDPDKDKIIAGHIDINKESYYPKCLENATYFIPNFCCVNVAQIPQMNTSCTIQRMIQGHGNPEHSNSTDHVQFHFEDNKNSSSQRHIEKPVHCQIENIPTVYTNNMGCPANDGCFGTRSLMKSQNDILPSGCLGDAEDYINDNITSSSSTLACRVISNFNKCSVVYSVDGKQNVVCCCESLDENNACKTNMEKVPEKIGKMVSTFRTPKPLS